MVNLPFKDRGTYGSKRWAKCPKCSSEKTGCENASPVNHRNIQGIGRHRFCKDCNHTWKTVEVTAEWIMAMVDLVDTMLEKRGEKDATTDN